jgi:magnesium-transporting ATPase (P-type)
MGIILQGLQEGGVITTVGLYFGDRLYEIKYIILLHAFILYIVVNICMKKNIVKASKRQVNTSSSLMFISTVTIYDIESLYNNPEHIQRQLSMFFVMIYICSFWTFFTWYKGFRTIEIHMKNPTYNSIINIKSNTTPPSPTVPEYYVKPVTNLDTFYILTYDVIFEIGIAYLLFYNLFLI